MGLYSGLTLIWEANWSGCWSCAKTSLWGISKEWSSPLLRVACPVTKLKQWSDEIDVLYPRESNPQVGERGTSQAVHTLPEDFGKSDFKGASEAATQKPGRMTGRLGFPHEAGSPASGVTWVTEAQLGGCDDQVSLTGVSSTCELTQV